MKETRLPWDDVDADVQRDLANLRRAPVPPHGFERGLERLTATIGREAKGDAARGGARSVFVGSWKAGLLATVLFAGTIGMATRIREAPPTRGMPNVSHAANVAKEGSEDVAVLGAAQARRAAAASDSAAVGAGDVAEPTQSSVPAAPTSSAVLTIVSSPAALPAASVEAKAKSAVPAASTGVHAELAHMRKLRDLAAADPARGLEMAEAGQRRFPGGVFVQEREVIAIDALQRIGQIERARTRARRFLAEHDESPFADKVRPIAQ